MPINTIEEKKSYAGISLLALSVVLLPLLLIRVFSITLGYPYAYAAVTLALFGVPIGGCLVYRLQHLFYPARSKSHLAWTAYLYSISVPVSLLAVLCIPLVTSDAWTLVDYFSLILICLLGGIPFVLAGISIALMVSRFPPSNSRIYSCLLLGMGLAFPLAAGLLEILDSPSAVVASAVAASLAAGLLSREGRAHRLSRTTTLTAVLLVTFVLTNTLAGLGGRAFFKVRWVQGRIEEAPLAESSNQFGRLQVRPLRYEGGSVQDQGWSPALSSHPPRTELELTLDGVAFDILTKYNGNVSSLNYLDFDIANLGYSILSPSSLLVVGLGGGRGILSGLAQGTDEISVLEPNSRLIQLFNWKLGDFTGHLDQDERIQFIAEDPRHYLLNHDELFDLIHIPCLGPAATLPTMAYTHAEDDLFTTETWALLQRRMSPTGLLSCSRRYRAESPGEIYRLTALAAKELKDSGIRNPRDHLFLAACCHPDPEEGIATLLAKMNPITDGELKALTDTCQELKYQILLSPQEASDPTLANIASGRPVSEFAENIPYRIAPPTDDRPFFFHLAGLRDVFSFHRPIGKSMEGQLEAPRAIALLLVAAILLVLFMVFSPPFRAAAGSAKGARIPLLIFFSFSGMGFGFIVSTLVPSVSHLIGGNSAPLISVFPSLLAGGALGAFLMRGIKNPAFIGVILNLLSLILLTAYGLYFGVVYEAFLPIHDLIRIPIALAFLTTLGLLLGTLFTLGLKVTAERASPLSAWLWSCHTAFLIFGAILSAQIAIAAGYSHTFWIALACFAASFAGFVWSCALETYSTVAQDRAQKSAEEEGEVLTAEVIEFRDTSA